MTKKQKRFVDEYLIDLNATQAAIRAGKMAGSHIVVPTPERISLALKQGYTLLALGVDEWFLRNGAAMALQALKTAAENGRS